MTLNELKTEIESRTNYKFDEGKNVLDNDVLRLKGLNKKTEITLCISYYRTYDDRNGKKHIGVTGTDNRDGYSGFGCPCDTVNEVIRHLDNFAPRYGWVKPKAEQIKLC